MALSEMIRATQHNMEPSLVESKTWAFASTCTVKTCAIHSWRSIEQSIRRCRRRLSLRPNMILLCRQLMLPRYSLEESKGEVVLAFSNCSNSLSCCLLSFAHFANSSWLLVAFISFRTFMNWLFRFRCSAANLEEETLL